MSRYIIKPRHADHKVTAGWDPALDTFFFEVVDTKQNKIAAYVGNKPGEIIEPIDLYKRVHRYGYLNAETKDKLKADRDAGRKAS